MLRATKQTALGGLEPKEMLTKRDEKKEKREFVETFMYALQAPVIWGSPWGESYPKSCTDDATLFRLIELPKLMKEEVCTNYEARLHLLSAALEHSIGYEWSTIAVWCVCQYKNYKEVMKDEYEEINKNMLDDLKWLKQKIFSSQMRRLRASMNDTVNEIGKSSTESEPKETTKQTALF